MLVNGSARVRYVEYVSLLTPTVAEVPPEVVFRIGSAPVAFSMVSVPPKFIGVKLL